MRLTLRTLLAYLDNTLDPQDAEALRNKLGESGFATQLVQRIRGSLADGSLPAPSPEAVGPVEEANVISEYLDSTLPSEQVAEIERACLESAPHLAEAAACHQILTMILGKPAEVSPELRKRVYELPDRRVEDIAALGNFSAVSIPVDGPQLKPFADDLPTADMTSEREGEPVQPVGASDSGVSDAPTRLREAEAASAKEDGGRGAIAGSKPRSNSDVSSGFGGSVRPSRIAPWIVSLALAGVLLFALTRIFQPLFKPQAVSLDVGDARPGEIEVPAQQAPVMVEVDGAEDADSTASDSTGNGDEAELLPEPAMLPQPLAAPTPEVTQAEPETSNGIGSPATDGAADGVRAADTADGGSTEAASSAKMPVESTVVETSASDASGNDAPGVPPGSPAAAPTAAATAATPEPETASTPLAAPKADAAVPPPGSKVVAPAKKQVAKIVGEESLIAALVGDKWVRLKNEMVVAEGVMIACAPTFRGRMTVDNAEITMVGPGQAQWHLDAENVPTLHIEFGRILASATKAGASLNVQLGNDTFKMTFTDVGAMVAASVKHFRAPGFDPLKPENRVPVIGVLAVQGGMEMTLGGQQVSLQTHQQWIRRGKAEATISAVEAASLPGWIDPPDPATSTLEASARSGLLTLLGSGQPLEISLREAARFRRTEVGALAAQTMANLGQGDIYFGGDGILSAPKQRAYWPDHFTTLLGTVDRSAESAQRLRDSIERMDSANVQPLFRLLTGYSQKQLIEGGDEELVELLDSSSMSVRVLALENLHRITGTTLYFRAEQENAVRRAPVIKKWVARLRKGDIRWQE